MALKLVLFACLVGFSYQSGTIPDATNAIVDYVKGFSNFMKNFNRSYKDDVERQARFENFKKNFQELLAIQKEHQGTATFGVNDLMDLSKEEKKNRAGFRNVVKPDPSQVEPPVDAIRAKRQTAPSSYNWQSYNKVTSVKNQGNCGSCWAFSSIAVIESSWAIKNGTLLDLSEQNLVSCVSQNSGCAGGWAPYAMVYTRTSGIATEANYPYTATNGTCLAKTGKTLITDWWYVGTDESQLTYQLYSKGPLVYSMWVPNSMYYLNSTSGVYYPSTTDCQNAANAGAGHAVAVVGYGVDSASGYPYWLIKNSWGTGWGNAGYFKLYRGASVCSMGNSWWAASATAAPWTCSNVQTEDNCKYWQGLGYCASTSQYYSYMQSNCKAACGWCSSG